MMAFSLLGYENSVIAGVFALLGASVGLASNYFVQRMMQGKQDERERIMHQRAVQKERRERLRAEYARLVRSAKIMEGYFISSVMSGVKRPKRCIRNATLTRAVKHLMGSPKRELRCLSKTMRRKQLSQSTTTLIVHFIGGA